MASLPPSGEKPFGPAFSPCKYLNLSVYNTILNCQEFFALFASRRAALRQFGVAPMREVEGPEVRRSAPPQTGNPRALKYGFEMRLRCNACRERTLTPRASSALR
jgi:hypothetical protein